MSDDEYSENENNNIQKRNRKHNNNNSKIPFSKIISMKPKLLNNFIDFCTTDELFEMFQLNNETTNILLKTNLSKAYFNIRKEFMVLKKDKNEYYNEMITSIKKKKEIIKMLDSSENKIINFDKYSLSQLLKNNCEIIRKIISKYKIGKANAISIFGNIILRQLRKENIDEININDYELNNNGIEMINLALAEIDNLKKISISNNLQINKYYSINNVINNNRSDLQIINLSFNELGDKNAIKIFDNLSKYCPDINIINLSGNKITKKVFNSKLVIDAFNNNGFKFLKKFIFHHNILGSKGAIFLFDLLINCKFLNLLDISYNGIDEYCFDSDSAIKFFDNEKSELYYFYSFYYEGNYLSFSETSSLVQCILNNKIISYLFLGNNRLDDESMEILKFLIMQNDSIKSLSINYNNFTFEGYNKFFTGIEENLSLNEINLSNNKINQKSLKKILECLSENKRIGSLDLSYNNFNKAATSNLIIKYMESNTTIKNLNLAGCHIGIGMKQLLSILKDNKILSFLDISLNDFGGNNEIIKNLCNFLKENFYIKYLYLDGNFINDQDFEKIINDGITMNTNLNSVSLKNNKITLNKIESKDPNRNIINNIKMNNHIKNIKFDGNPIKSEKNLKLIEKALEMNGTKENIEYVNSQYID